MISLIGITGLARSGKDTVGGMLLSHMPAATRFAFADKIKEFLEDALEYGESAESNKEGSVLFMTTRADIETAMLNVLHKGMMMYDVDVADMVDEYVHILKAYHGICFELQDGRILFTSSWRKLYQLTGTEFGRQKINERFWIDPWLPDENAVVTDVRGHGDTQEHRNVEALSIIQKGGLVIQVVDPRKGHVVRGHASEAGIEGNLICHTIVNDGTLEDLEAKVCDFIYVYILQGEHE
ncbi:deoxynucleoside-5-monophosphate kinase [Vibrio phage CHOED]|uniref:deoxynucleoside-5-monophosphate kinase n=1 Tax=Vibrio phage CHOED TaxID=1458716 RepID=UPI00042EC3E3|nr:deoxynucleoside-5-monophosphate kinase [Vibrio phage CHOED]AHK11891.1 deoxynucleoside-5-monophosphate kinase [Vibrio phage CHOED]